MLVPNTNSLLKIFEMLERDFPLTLNNRNNSWISDQVEQVPQEKTTADLALLIS